MGSELILDSEYGRGTTFSFILDLPAKPDYGMGLKFILTWNKV